MSQQQLEAQYLLAGIYRNEKDLTNEIYTIEEAINTASRIDDKEWLFYLYSYLGDIYIKKYNTLKFIKYQTLANQCIKDIDYRNMSISTKVLAAKNLLYTEQYQSSYDKLKEIESSISKNNTYYNEIKRLQELPYIKCTNGILALKVWKKHLEQKNHQNTCSLATLYRLTAIT